MRIRFWGVRGSIPTPLTQARLRSKISSILERASPADLADEESRERFLAGLPDFLFSTVGGNTACVEIETGSAERLILDAGTGIRELGNEIMARRETARCHLFLSHFHWDHIQGLPFFSPAYVPGNKITFYSSREDFRELLEAQMREPYFPIGMAGMAAEKSFVRLGDDAVEAAGARIIRRRVSHPGGCDSFRIEAGGRKLVYSTDTELREEDFARSPENARFFEGVDALVIDAQYTLGEAIEKYNWGHSSFSLAADFAATWGIKRLVLFHHEPAYSDRKVEGILKSAEHYLEHLDGSRIQVILAREGSVVELGA